MPRRPREKRPRMSGVASSEYLLLAGAVLLLAIIVGRVWGPQINQATGHFFKKVGCTLAGEGLASCSPEALAAAGPAAAPQPAKPGETGAGSGTPPDNASQSQAGGDRTPRGAPTQAGGGGRSSMFSLTTVLVVLLVGLILLWLVARRRG